MLWSEDWGEQLNLNLKNRGLQLHSSSYGSVIEYLCKHFVPLGIWKEWKWEKDRRMHQKSKHQIRSQRNWSSRNQTLHVQVKEHCTVPFCAWYCRYETRGIIKIKKYLFHIEITLTLSNETLQINVLQWSNGKCHSLGKNMLLNSLRLSKTRLETLKF